MPAVLQVSDVRAVIEEMRDRGVKFEEYDTAETRTENGVARTPDGREGRGPRTRNATLSALFAPWPPKDRGAIAVPLGALRKRQDTDTPAVARPVAAYP
jgi:hypothetical protein